jgi:prepilin-type N-terminal cleavage/methylation domain-containing protein
VRARPRRRRGRQRGFTLIELMVALVVSSLLVGMLFAIFVRMSSAYRGQQQVAEVQSKLAAARAKIELDAKQAGLYMAQGFYSADDVGLAHSPLQVINGGSGPDEIRFYYADTSVQAVTRAGVGTVCTAIQCDRFDAPIPFAAGDLVLMSTATYLANPEFPVDARIATFHACLLQVSAAGPTSMTFAQGAPWGTGSSLHCQGGPVAGTTIFYKLAARRWRIDPARPAEGVLQLSTLPPDPSGAPDVWQDQAYGFTDLQVATRFYEAPDPADPSDLAYSVDTPDPDEDPTRDWYSGPGQDNLTRPGAKLTTRPPIQVSISLVARTEHDVEGVASSSTPHLTVTNNEDNNTIGDREAIALPSVLPALAGNRIYRYTTFQVDLRNLGVGR